MRSDHPGYQVVVSQTHSLLLSSLAGAGRALFSASVCLNSTCFYDHCLALSVCLMTTLGKQGLALSSFLLPPPGIQQKLGGGICTWVKVNPGKTVFL